MNTAQINAFQANSGITPADVATVLLGAVFAALLVWGVWALRSAYGGWAEEQLSQRQFLVVVVRVVVLYLALTFFLLS
ncbi:MAG: TIGR03758 family integrating conjugative element protein [Pseudomonas sp.]|nr:TIGR03758 family integrating conjugative element protein [Pseudomonas sp.]